MTLSPEAPPPLGLAGKGDAGAVAETETADVVVETVLPQREADADCADVRRMHHHVFEGDQAVTVMAVLVNLRVADLNEAVAAIDNLRRRDQGLFDTRPARVRF